MNEVNEEHWWIIKMLRKCQEFWRRIPAISIALQFQGQECKLKSIIQFSSCTTLHHPQMNHSLLRILAVRISECHSQKSKPSETLIIELLTFTAFSKEKGQ